MDTNTEKVKNILQLLRNKMDSSDIESMILDYLKEPEMKDIEMQNNEDESYFTNILNKLIWYYPVGLYPIVLM
jgi:hypothetical protein